MIMSFVCPEAQRWADYFEKKLQGSVDALRAEYPEPSVHSSSASQKILRPPFWAPFRPPFPFQKPAQLERVLRLATGPVQPLSLIVAALLLRPAHFSSIDIVASPFCRTTGHAFMLKGPMANLSYSQVKTCL